MPATLVVDGYNAVMSVRKGKELMKGNLKTAREFIVSISKEYARSSGYINRVKIIFDGDDKYRTLSYLDISRENTQVFSRTDQCDDEIIRIVRSYSEHSKVIVASRDNYVRNRCRPYASLLDPEELFSCKRKQYTKKKEPVKKIDPEVTKMITEEYRRKLGL